MGAEHTFFFEGILLRDKTLYKTNGKQDIGPILWKRSSSIKAWLDQFDVQKQP